MILISGEALVDLIPDPDKEGRYDAVRGGSPYNVAIGLGRLGAPAAFVSRISADANGEALAAALAAEGVSLEFVARDAKPTPLAFVMRGTAQTGSRYAFYLDATAYDGRWPFPTAWPQGARHLHVGSIAAVDPRHGESVLAALRTSREGATTSFDPNIRPLVTPDRDAVRALVERQAALATLVKASEEDIEWLYPGRSVEDALADWALSGPAFCVATLGERGAVAMLGREKLSVPAPRIEVVDTVGAGDSFMSSLLAAMDRDGALGAKANAPTRRLLEGWLAFAATASAIACTRRGSNPPTLAEIATFQGG
ncbi:MAG: carbohydrate kinase [Hyphomicrobiales bacterium]|nr:carbohydrate kinase [Hyphomicrobiales bacterium]